MDRQWAESNEASNEYKRQYLDTEDRVVLAGNRRTWTHPQGGVYFFGASNMKWAMCVPDLPPEQRKLVHNFGAGEGSPYFHRQFTEFLVNHKDLLRSRAGKDADRLRHRLPQRQAGQRQPYDRLLEHVAPLRTLPTTISSKASSRSRGDVLAMPTSWKRPAAQASCKV